MEKNSEIASNSHNTSPFLEKKKRDSRFGKFAENIAAEYYMENGYRLLERNWRVNHIEIDLIAQKDNTVVFVEVKARKGNCLSGLESVSRSKMKRLLNGAHIYLKILANENYEYRMDIFALTGDEKEYKIDVYEDAFVYSMLM